VKYEVRLSHRAERDLDRLDKPTQMRIVRRMEQLAEDPYDSRTSAPLSGVGNLRKSRVADLSGLDPNYSTSANPRFIYRKTNPPHTNATAANIAVDPRFPSETVCPSGISLYARTT
jgi:hypothetical protein